MDRPVENMHVSDLKNFLTDHFVSFKGLKVNTQYVQKEVPAESY